MADGLGPELREILAELSVRSADELSDDALARRLTDHKTACAAALATRLRADPHIVQRAPAAFRWPVEQLRELT